MGGATLDDEIDKIADERDKNPTNHGSGVLLGGS